MVILLLFKPPSEVEKLAGRTPNEFNCGIIYKGIHGYYNTTVAYVIATSESRLFMYKNKNCHNNNNIRSDKHKA